MNEEGKQEEGQEEVVIEPVDFGIGEGARIRATGSEARKQPGRMKKIDEIMGDDPGLMTKTKAALQAQRKVKITIPSTESDKTDVMIGVNGYVFQIQRDKEVEVPYDVMEVLMNAKFTTYNQRPRTEYGPNGEKPEGMELVASEVLRFPYQRTA